MTLIGYYLIGPRIAQSSIGNAEAVAQTDRSAPAEDEKLFEKDDSPMPRRRAPVVSVEGRVERSEEPQPQELEPEPEVTPEEDPANSVEIIEEPAPEQPEEEVPVAPPVDEAGSGGAAGDEQPTEPIEQPLSSDPPPTQPD